jgi:hypothetical protein
VALQSTSILEEKKALIARKKTILRSVREALSKFGVKVVPFGNTLVNGSSVLELTIPYERHQLFKETEPLDPEHKEDYEEALRSIGINFFHVYPM